jgi:hypothetical protein
MDTWYTRYAGFMITRNLGTYETANAIASALRGLQLPPQLHRRIDAIAEDIAEELNRAGYTLTLRFPDP